MHSPKLLLATHFINYLSTLPCFTPPSEQSTIPFLRGLLAAAINAEEQAAAALINYRNAVSLRRTAFDNGPDSLRKMLSPILATAKATFGPSANTLTIATLIRKIRGEKSADHLLGNAVSQGQKSYELQVQHFRQIINCLDGHTTARHINVLPLQKKLEALEACNQFVAEATGALKQKRKEKAVAFRNLFTALRMARHAVKSQYGWRSSEFVGLKQYSV